MITAIDEVRVNGEELNIRFSVDECTKCIWYNDTDLNNPKLEVEYKAATESFFVPAEMTWSGIDRKSKCTNLGALGGPTVCTVDITANSVEVICD